MFIYPKVHLPGEYKSMYQVTRHVLEWGESLGQIPKQTPTIGEDPLEYIVRQAIKTYTLLFELEIPIALGVYPAELENPENLTQKAKSMSRLEVEGRSISRQEIQRYFKDGRYIITLEAFADEGIPQFVLKGPHFE